MLPDLILYTNDYLYEEVDLVNAVQENTEMTYETFYSEYHGKILKYLTAKCGRREDAEDLTSQVFLYCYQNFSRYDPAKSSIASWVYMIANSRFKNYCRDRRSFADIDEVGQFLPDEKNLVDAAIMLDEMRDSVARALLRLPERQRMIVVLRYFRNMSAAEIGSRLGMSPVNVRVQLSRALDRLEAELEELR